MPQNRYFCAPAQAQLRERICNRNGNHVPDLHRYNDRRVKWARRRGRRIEVMLEGPQLGRPGMILVFDSPDLYEQCVRRIFLPLAAARRPASSREQLHDCQIPQPS